MIHFKYLKDKEKAIKPCDELVRINLEIENPLLLKVYDYQDDLSVIGLKKFCSELCIYLPNKIYYVPSPDFSKDESSNIWEVGTVDLFECQFFELGILVSHPMKYNCFMEEWVDLLKKICDNRLYSDLFNAFGELIIKIFRKEFQ